VVTASVHINLGLDAMEPLFAGLRLLRCEAALLLALSASSPFLDGRATGAHSQRWLQFPLTPAQVPLFRDHAHYIAWMEEQLRAGTMRNVRHLWTSVRPNGEDRPHDLNRLEIRICDLVADPELLLAITAWTELRLQQLLLAPERHDPLRASRLDAGRLAALADANDQRAARSSLDADLLHWRDGEPIAARRWLADSLEAMAPLASDMGLMPWLASLEPLLAAGPKGGNQAMRWLSRYRAGESIAAILTEDIGALAAREQALAAGLATDIATPLG
jgi:predicted glutamate--cysteine ligase